MRSPRPRLADPRAEAHLARAELVRDRPHAESRHMLRVEHGTRPPLLCLCDQEPASRLDRLPASDDFHNSTPNALTVVPLRLCERQSRRSKASLNGSVGWPAKQAPGSRNRRRRGSRLGRDPEFSAGSSPSDRETGGSRPEGKRPGPRFGRHPHVRIAHRRGSMQAKDGVTEQDFRNCDERKAGSAWV
jgi:hypothetical protein